jgi:hypothetical protein
VTEYVLTRSEAKLLEAADSSRGEIALPELAATALLAPSELHMVLEGLEAKALASLGADGATMTFTRRGRAVQRLLRRRPVTPLIRIVEDGLLAPA